MVLIFDVIDLPLWPLLLPLIIFLLYMYGTYPYSYWKQLGYPDGPPPAPFIGTMRNLFDSGTGSRASIREMQGKYGRIIPMYSFRDPSLLVTDPDALRDVFVKNFNVWADRYQAGGNCLQQRIIKKGLFFNDNKDWKRVRKIMSPTFSSGKLKLLSHYMNLTSVRLSEKLLQYAESSKPALAKIVFGAFSLDVICGIAFGLDTNAQNDHDNLFMKHVRSVMSFENDLKIKLSLSGMFPIIGRIFQMFNVGFFRYRDVRFFEENVSSLIEERKLGNTKHIDFLQLLLNAEASEADEIEGARKLSTEEITAQGIIFILAGYDTTSSAMQFLTYELSQNQDIQDKLRKEVKAVLGEDEKPRPENVRDLKYMEAVINETLRMYPPIHMISRKALEDTKLNELPVPKGTSVLIPIGNIGRDPEFYPEPDVFRPERFLGDSGHSMDPVTFLPFGFGPRQCIGMRLAQMEIKVALVHMLRTVKIVGSTPQKLEIVDYSGVLVPKVPVQLHLEPIIKN